MVSLISGLSGSFPDTSAGIGLPDHLAILIQPLGHNMGRKGAAVPLFGWTVTVSPSNTMSPEPRPISLPRGISIHPAVCIHKLKYLDTPLKVKKVKVGFLYSAAYTVAPQQRASQSQEVAVDWQ